MTFPLLEIACAALRRPVDMPATIAVLPVPDERSWLSVQPLELGEWSE